MICTMKESLKKTSVGKPTIVRKSWKREEKVVSYTKIVGKLKGKTSVIYIKPEERLFHDYYPNSKEWFVHYFGEIYNDSIIGHFEFQPLRLDLVITEKEKGLFQANLNAPSCWK